ncbi:putative dna replication initiation factor cdc45 [Golovinomyces cichoracearum]|uniref:Putative dna replication initiation factor cdc45 n=1 Tax=Golovinomyces cichoracearum TaxID=62708 RepID=A0A420H7X3_9PEZI|nr:putative dna replication initiation factor cdc45 [Golovinomyces cichoracearum]
MGVSRLIATLKCFARPQSLEGVAVVIDGNALAYHIYYSCLGARSRTKNAFEAQPKYTELSELTYAWLEALIQSKLTIEKIYFDGFLPPSKLETRLSRLTTVTLQLQRYFRSYATQFQNSTIHKKDDDDHVSLFGAHCLPVQFASPPPLPFIVSAVLETLCKSEKYKDRTEVVPWEADLYCAMYVKKNGGLVLTGDSDLLIHDLGPDGKVCFFNDIEQSSLGSKPSSLVYHPSAIISTLGLEKSHGLSCLAFEVLKEPHHNSLSTIFQQALCLKAAKKYPIEYQNFTSEYAVTFTKDNLEAKESQKILLSLQTLDPRVSEYILQFPRLARAARQLISINSRQTPYNVFLPLLLDSPTRTSSWEISANIRELAYGLVNLMVPLEERVTTVVEYRRQQAKNGGRVLSLPSFTDLPKLCNSYLDLLLTLKKKLPNLSHEQFWIASAVYQEKEWSESQGKKSLSELVREFLDLDLSSDQVHRWDIIHLVAQIDGSLYSLRILYQVASILMNHGCGGSIPPALRQLYQFLRDLPNIVNFQDFDSITYFLHDHLEIILMVIDDILGLAHDQEILDRMGITQEVNVPQIEEASRQISHIDLMSNNPFALLGLE